MAFTFINLSQSQSASATTLTLNKPTNTADNDIMFAIITSFLNDISSAPTGWTRLHTYSYSSVYYNLYYKIASSEGASYNWSIDVARRMGGQIYTYRDGFDTSDPIDVSSNIEYVTDDTTVRAGTITISATNSPLLFFGACRSASDKTYTKPTVPTTDWTEQYDTWNDLANIAFEHCSMVWSSSGATGNIDATLSASSGGLSKHGFAVALNPPSLTNTTNFFQLF